MPYFPFSGRLVYVLNEDFEPDIFGIPQMETVDCETLHLFIILKDRQGYLRDLCRENWFHSNFQGVIITPLVGLI